jgi:hypothetical protein
MTTTLRKAITGLILLVFLPVGDAQLLRRGDVVAATNFAANEPRALLDSLAERQPSPIQDDSKNEEDSGGETNVGYISTKKGEAQIVKEAQTIKDSEDLPAYSEFKKKGRSGRLTRLRSKVGFPVWSNSLGDLETFL